MIVHFLQSIIESPLFQVLVGSATIFGFIAIFYQIRRDSVDVRVSRTMDLIGRYNKDYHDLILWPKDGKIPVGHEREDYRKNYEKQLNFLYELARYWKRGLVDKQILKDELAAKIAFETFNLQDINQRFYKDETQYMDRLKILVEMRDEIVAKDPMNYKLMKFWKKLGLKK